ncbi:MAG: hypothetical protein WAK55_11620 [Xanthobacteraceae bacterium]
MGEIIALTRMTEGDYDAARAVIGNRKDAKPKWDQELCTLFTASGWATEALARKEGIHPRTMQQRLLFGRFLAFAEKRGATRARQCLNGLTEWRFRRLWRATVNTGNEYQRFDAVLKVVAGAPIAARAIPSTELFTKLSPIIEALMEYGTRHRVQDNPPAVAKLALDLRKLLDEWTK